MNKHDEIVNVPRDRSKRSTQMFDDRDGDTLTSLSTKIIKVCDEKTPDMVFFLVPQKGEPNSVAETINLEVIHYVRMGVLSQDLKDRVRDEITEAKKLVRRATPEEG